MYCRANGNIHASLAIAVCCLMSPAKVLKSSRAYGVVIRKTTKAAAALSNIIGITRTDATKVKSDHRLPARSFATHKKDNASGASMGATDIFGAIAKPTNAPSSNASRYLPPSTRRSIAHNAPNDVNTVNGSGR